MSNPSLLINLFAAGDAGELEAFDQYLHNDVVVHAPGGLSTVGLESERESWRKAKSAIPDLRHQFVDIFSNSTAEAARCVVTGTMRGSYGGFSSEGRAFRVDQAVFAHVRDGKITELWEIIDTAVLREQLGEAGRQASGAPANNASQRTALRAAADAERHTARAANADPAVVLRTEQPGYGTSLPLTGVRNWSYHDSPAQGSGPQPEGHGQGGLKKEFLQTRGI